MLDLNLLDLDKEKQKDTDGNIEEISSKDVAVIGLSMKMPWAQSTDEFWNNLKQGMDCITDFPETRRKDFEFSTTSLQSSEFKNSDNIVYKRGSYLEKVDEFDCGFFNISPREASLMDPNQRIFLEVAWNSLEDAGYGGEKRKGSHTGIYCGYVSDLAYQRLISAVEPASLGVSIPGNMAAIIPGRIAYILDLKGPALLIDTTCSSALVAIHTACSAMRNGDCDMAIAGSIKINIFPVEDDNMLGIESRNYICKAFDNEADGTCMGEGIMAVVLKPLSRALKDRDHIYAVIKGSALNQDGTSMGITAPNPTAQADVIESAWKAADINPETISYIETHGTGTKLGDPIEIDGISRAFNKYTDKKQFCAIGSVKTNLGHLDSAAGMIGFVKAVLALKHKQIPPSINFNIPNRNIEFEQSPVFVNNRLLNWEQEEFPRRCGVSAFGLSGTNAHIVLEEAPPVRADKDIDTAHILSLSAKSKTALKSLVLKYIEFFQHGFKGRGGDVSYTANTGRGHYTIRLAVIYTTLEDIKNKLLRFYENRYVADEANGIYYGEHRIPGNNNEMKIPELSEAEYKRISDLASTETKKLRNKKYIDRDLEELCKLYVTGAFINWEELYKKGNFNRISLPTYAFERTRCWINLPYTIENRDNQNHMSDTSGYGDDNRSLEQTLEKINNLKVVLKGKSDGDYSDLEIQIARVWKYILGFDEINVHDNFFDMGGTSVMIIQLNHLLNKILDRQIETIYLFQYPSIQSLSQYLSQDAESVDSEQESMERIDDSINIMEDSLEKFREM